MSLSNYRRMIESPCDWDCDHPHLTYYEIVDGWPGTVVRVATDLWADLKRNPPAGVWMVKVFSGTTEVRIGRVPVIEDPGLASGRWALDRCEYLVGAVMH